MTHLYLYEVLKVKSSLRHVEHNVEFSHYETFFFFFLPRLLFVQVVGNTKLNGSTRKVLYLFLPTFSFRVFTITYVKLGFFWYLILFS